MSERAGIASVTSASSLAKSSGAFLPTWSVLVIGRCGAVALGRTYLLPPLSSGGALVAQPWLRFHIPLIEPGRADLLHPALGQNFTPSPTARRVQARLGVRARSARRGARVD